MDQELSWPILERTRLLDLPAFVFQVSTISCALQWPGFAQRGCPGSHSRFSPPDCLQRWVLGAVSMTVLSSLYDYWKLTRDFRCRIVCHLCAEGRRRIRF